MGGHGLNSSGSEHGPMIGSFDDNNEASGSIKRWVFFEYLS